MHPRAKETDESRFRRAELRLLKRAHHRRHLEVALGGLLIVAIVAVIFWLIGLSPPHEPRSRNETPPPGQSAASAAMSA